MRPATADYRLETAVTLIDSALESLHAAVHLMYLVLEDSGDMVRLDVFDIESNNVMVAIEKHLDPFFETIGFKLGHEWTGVRLDMCRGLAEDAEKNGGVL